MARYQPSYTIYHLGKLSKHNPLGYENQQKVCYIALCDNRDHTVGGCQPLPTEAEPYPSVEPWLHQRSSWPVCNPRHTRRERASAAAATGNRTRASRVPPGDVPD
jgi:hypothetical protein